MGGVHHWLYGVSFLTDATYKVPCVEPVKKLTLCVKDMVRGKHDNLSIQNIRNLFVTLVTIIVMLKMLMMMMTKVLMNMMMVMMRMTW